MCLLSMLDWPLSRFSPSPVKQLLSSRIVDSNAPEPVIILRTGLRENPQETPFPSRHLSVVFFGLCVSPIDRWVLSMCSTPFGFQVTLCRRMPCPWATAACGGAATPVRRERARGAGRWRGFHGWAMCGMGGGKRWESRWLDGN